MSPTEPTLSEVYIDDKKIAKIQWSKSATIAMVSGAPQATLKDSQRKKGDTVAVPAGLLVPKTYLIWSEVSYTYKPAIGYVMAKAGITLKNQSYTRPRQSDCVNYPAPAWLIVRRSRSRACNSIGRDKRKRPHLVRPFALFSGKFPKKVAPSFGICSAGSAEIVGRRLA